MFFAPSCKVRRRFAFHGRPTTQREPNPHGRTSNEETSMKRPSIPAHHVGSIVFVLASGVFFGAACGGAPALSGATDSKTPAMAEAPAPANLDEARAQLAQAEHNVFGAFGQYKPEAQGGFATPPGTSVQQPTTPPPRATEASAPPPPPNPDSAMTHKESEARAFGGGDVPGQAATGASSSPCETACRALASMNRAAMHICALAGDDSDSCTNARERVRNATERVRQSCSECAGN